MENVTGPIPFSSQDLKEMENNLVRLAGERAVFTYFRLSKTKILHVYLHTHCRYSA